MTQRYSKIKYDGDRVQIRWLTGNLNGTTTEHVLTSTEKPSPEFTKALANFIKPIEKVLELTDLNQRDGYFGSCTGLSISEENDDGYRGLIVTLTRHLAKIESPVVVNTPLLEIKGAVLSKLVGTAEHHAERFCAGARFNGDLFMTVATDDEGKTKTTITKKEPVLTLSPSTA